MLRRSKGGKSDGSDERRDGAGKGGVQNPATGQATDPGAAFPRASLSLALQRAGAQQAYQSALGQLGNVPSLLGRPTMGRQWTLPPAGPNVWVPGPAGMGAVFAPGGPITMPGAYTPPQPKHWQPQERLEPVEGWREYQLSIRAGKEGPEVFLVGAGQGFTYDGRLARARCGHGLEAEQLCEAHLETPEACMCGFWAVGSQKTFIYGTGVVGRVLGFGTVAVDADGNFRATHLQLEEVALDRRHLMLGLGLSDGWFEFVEWGRIVSLLRDRYAVPVTLKEASNG